MNLDIQTAIGMMVVNVFTVALGLPVLSRWRVSTGARWAKASVLFLAVAWAGILCAGMPPKRWIGTLATACVCLSFVSLWYALRYWLGERPGRAWLWPLAVLTPAGYFLGFDSFALRTAWSSIGGALLIALVCLALVAPAPHASRRWRGLMFLCLAALMVVTAWRGVLAGFFSATLSYFQAPHPVNVAWVVLNLVAMTGTTMAALVAWREESERDLQTLAQNDGLTGLLNRRTFMARAEELLAPARRHRETLLLLLIDIDHFKQINDCRGHAAGDRALQLFADALRSCLRRGDLTCRYGGEEFCVLLTRSGEGAARAFDARLREALQEQIAYEGPQAFPFSFSTGAAWFSEQDASLASLLQRADAALYQAKTKGRGCLVQDGTPTWNRTTVPTGTAG